jgi:hypothetical protein
VTPRLHHGDCRVVMRRWAVLGAQFDAVITDGPYHLESIVQRFGKPGSAPAQYGSDGRFRRSSGGFMGKCYHPDTEIMTKTGWVRVGDVDERDVVATLNPLTRELEWQPVKQTHTYQFDGDLVYLKHRSAEQMVTPNHNILISTDGGETLGLLEANATPRAFHQFSQARASGGTAADPITITSQREFGKERRPITETKTYPTKPFFRFFGLWLGDGYTTNRTNDHPANDFFGLAVVKERKVLSIRDTLRALGIKFTETLGADGRTNFYCYDFVLLGFLKQFGGAKDKFIPAWMFERGSSELEEIYFGLMETDGCYQGKNQEVYYTISKYLSDDFQRLCLQTGRSAISVLKKGGKRVVIMGHKTVTSDGYTLCVLQPMKRLYCENSDRNGNIINHQYYSGPVHCVGVEKHHILYTQLNGKPVWSGNSWDGADKDGVRVCFDPATWRACYDLMKPGAFILAFASPRTGHWQAVAMEQAGFVLHPFHGWLYGQGMPKAHSVPRDIDKLMGKRRRSSLKGLGEGWSSPWNQDEEAVERSTRQYIPGSPEGRKWDGWYSGAGSVKPCLEPIYIGQKPRSERTDALNILAHGVGAYNIEASRIPPRDEADIESQRRVVGFNKSYSHGETSNSYSGGVDGSLHKRDREEFDPSKGRWPSQLYHDGSPEVEALFPDSAGQLARARTDGSLMGNQVYGKRNHFNYSPEPRNDSGSASRFFMSPATYAAKAPKKERDQFYTVNAEGKRVSHPTTKPQWLLEYLIRLVTPPGGRVLDPFAGSGSTGAAASALGYRSDLIEADPEYFKALQRRFGCL